MRNVLLITSALGLAAPALAMANGAAAGSSSAMCNSGFFAQFDAKIANAKLEIKNKDGKGSKVGNKEETDPSKILDTVANDVIAQLKAANVAALFDGGTQASKLQFLAQVFTAVKVEDIRGKDTAAIEAAIAKAFGVTGVFDTTAKRNLLNTATDATGATASVFAAGDSDTDRDNFFSGLVAGIDTLVKTFDPTIRGTINDAALESFVTQLSDPNPANVVAELLNTVKLKSSAYKKNLGGKILILNTGASTLSQAYKDAVKTGLTTALDLTTATGKTALSELKQSPVLAGYADGAAAENAKLNDAIGVAKKSEDAVLDRRVHHSALAGGVGVTAGWWQNMGNFALSISGSGDYLWGRFKTADDKDGETVKASEKNKLGFGLQGDVGLHCVVSPGASLGVLVGIRGQQLNIGRTNTNNNAKDDSKGDYTSKWMVNPVVAAQARAFFNDSVYGALTVGYIIPLSEKDFGKENTNIDKDAKVRFQGLTGSFSVGMVF